jgi:hypothetical protein
MPFGVGSVFGVALSVQRNAKAKPQFSDAELEDRLEPGGGAPVG